MDDAFIEHVLSRIAELTPHNKKIIFSISTTAKLEGRPYLTPVRVSDGFVLAGCVIFDARNLPSLIEKIDGIVDVLLADSERSLPDSMEHDLELPYSDDTSDLCTSIFSRCKQYVKHSKLIEFKPNDLTVNAAWCFLTQKLGGVGRQKVSILGAGNIGSKLALKLAESGARVSLFRRNSDNAKRIIEGLNLLKASGVSGNIEFFSDPMAAVDGSSAVVGASSGGPLIDRDIVEFICQSCLIVDLGKNNLTPSAISLATDRSMDICRTDVSPAIEGFVYEVLRTIDSLENYCGKKDLGFCQIVSGGYFGRHGDIVVDRIDSPNNVVGVARGDGLLKYDLDKIDKRNIEKIKDYFSIH